MRHMSKLQNWMTKNGWNDTQMAEAVGVSRVQINRIRRGVCGASVHTALRLQEITKIRWTHFIRPKEE